MSADHEAIAVTMAAWSRSHGYRSSDGDERRMRCSPRSSGCNRAPAPSSPGGGRGDADRLVLLTTAQCHAIENETTGTKYVHPWGKKPTQLINNLGPRGEGMPRLGGRRSQFRTLSPSTTPTTAKSRRRENRRTRPTRPEGSSQRRSSSTSPSTPSGIFYRHDRVGTVDHSVVSASWLRQRHVPCPLPAGGPPAGPLGSVCETRRAGRLAASWRTCQRPSLATFPEWRVRLEENNGNTRIERSSSTSYRHQRCSTSSAPRSCPLPAHDRYRGPDPSISDGWPRSTRGPPRSARAADGSCHNPPNGEEP